MGRGPRPRLRFSRWPRCLAPEAPDHRGSLLPPINRGGACQHESPRPRAAQGDSSLAWPLRGALGGTGRVLCPAAPSVSGCPVGVGLCSLFRPSPASSPLAAPSCSGSCVITPLPGGTISPQACAFSYLAGLGAWEPVNAGGARPQACQGPTEQAGSVPAGVQRSQPSFHLGRYQECLVPRPGPAHWPGLSYAHWDDAKAASRMP